VQRKLEVQAYRDSWRFSGAEEAAGSVGQALSGKEASGSEMTSGSEVSKFEGEQVREGPLSVVVEAVSLE
jgi:hypothetical protein